MREFKLSDNSEKSFEEFRDKHKKCTDALPMATDGKYPFSFIFTPGGIGTVIKVRCNGCGKEENITYYDNW